jgi:hypothetical protein
VFFSALDADVPAKESFAATSTKLFIELPTNPVAAGTHPVF